MNIQGKDILLGFPRHSDLSTGNSELFPHLLLGSRIKDTGFEGMSPLTGVEWTLSVVEGMLEGKGQDLLLEVPGLESVRDALKQLNETMGFPPLPLSEDWVDSQIQAKAGSIRERVFALKPGESHFLEGGYSTSTGGHAMFYRFKKEEDGKYTVVMYNAGEGAQWQTTVCKDGKARVIPFVVFTGVEEDELFIPLFQSLLELRILPHLYEGDERFFFKIEDVWRAFAPILHRMSDPAAYFDVDIKVQDTGVCSRKSLEALLLDLLRDKQKWKALGINSRLLALVHFYEANKNQLTPQTRLELREGGENFCQTLSNPEIASMIPEEKLEKFWRLVREILEKVESDPLPPPQSPVSLRVESHKTFNLQAVRKKEKEKKVEIATRVFRQSGNWAHDLDHLAKNLGVEEIELFFSRTLPPQKVADDPFWSGVEVSEKMLNGLEKVSAFYLSNLVEKGGIETAEQAITVMMLFAVMRELVFRFDEGKQNLLQDLSVSGKVFIEIFERNPSLLVKDPAIWNRYKTLQGYLVEAGRNKEEIFLYDQNGKIRSPLFAPEMGLYRDLLNKNPDFISDVRDRHLKRLNKNCKSIKEELKWTDLELMAFNSLWEVPCDNNRCDLFSQTGNRHIILLKQTVIDTLVAAFPNKGVTYLDGVHFHYESFHFTRFCKELLRVENRPRIATSPYFERDPEKIEAFDQGSHLIHAASLPPEEKRWAYFESACCDPASSVVIFLSRWLSDVSLVEEKRGRDLVSQVLYKASPTIPLFEAEPERTAELIRKIIKRGLAVYFYNRSLGTVHYLAALFFLEFAELAELGGIPGVYPSGVLEEIEKGLPKDVRLQQTVSLLKLHRLIFSKRIDWTKASILWMGLYLAGIPEESDLYRRVRRRWREVEHGLFSFTRLDEVLESLPGFRSSGNRWYRVKDTLTFSTQLADGEEFAMNLSTGQATYGGRLISFGKALEKNEAFRRIFGDRTIGVAVGIGKYFQFTDPVYKECRFTEGGSIQRKIGFHWYEYVDPETLSLPASLKNGYCHWLGTEEDLIYLSAEGKDRFVIRENGHIESLVYGNQEWVELLGNEPTLERFEPVTHLLVWRRRRGAGNRTRLEFPRYQSETGKPLSFTSHGRGWMYDGDPTYKMGGNSFFPYFHNTLTLTNGKSEKILIPFQKLESKGLSPEAKITLPPDTESGFTYFEYTVEGGRIQARPEGWLMLAAVYLAQKEYLQAKSCLDEIHLSTEATPLLQKLFKAFFLSGLRFKDKSANAMALLLHALWLVRKVDPFNPDYVKFTFENESFEAYDCMTIYLSRVADVLDPLLLPLETKEDLDRLLEKRPDYVQAPVYKDPGLQDVLYVDQNVLAVLNSTDKRYYKTPFLDAYERIRNGSEQERKEILYRLLWCEKSDLNRMLCFVAENPQNCPPAVSRDASNDQKMKWFKEVAEKCEGRVPNQMIISLDLRREDHPCAMAVGPVFIQSEEIRTPKVVMNSFEGELAKLRSEYLGKRKEGPQSEWAPLTIAKEELSESEQPFFTTIETEFAWLNQELEKGRLRRCLEAPIHIVDLKGEFKGKIRGIASEAEKELRRLEKEILTEVRANPCSGKERLRRELAGLAKRPKPIEMIDLARGSYKKVLPHYTEEEIEALDAKVALYMEIKTTLDQLRRIEKEGKGSDLEADRAYIPSENRAALYFEYMSGFRLRKSQAEKFKKSVELLEKGVSHIFQMIQGDGKGSVMLSRLMEYVGERGDFSVLVCHHSQFASAKGLATKFQKDRFGKNVIPLDFPSSSLRDLKVLFHIEEVMTGVQKRKDTLAITSSMIQSLELELIQTLMNSSGVEFEPRALALQRIVRQFVEKGVAMLDEVDLTLDILQKVNFPSGQRVSLDRELIQVVYRMFLVIDRHFTPLTHGERLALLECGFYENVLPEMAEEVISLHPGSKEELIRYLAGKGNEIFADLESWRLSADPLKKEAATAIFLVRGMASKVLQFTLKKEFNRKFGFSKEDPTRLIPFLAVDVPANTEFGDVYEHLAYKFIAAMESKIPKEAVEAYIAGLIELANHYVAKGEAFDETAEAEEFFELTGVKLGEAFRSNRFSKVVEAINKSSASRLKFTEKVAATEVTYFEKYLGSTPVALIDQFKTVIGCSGTVANFSSYHPRLATLLPDEGAEGKILSLLLDKIDQVREVDTSDLGLFVQEILAKVPPSRAQFFGDGGGILSEFSSKELAEAFLAHFKYSSVQGVVFFDGDHFSLLKQGEKRGIPLLNTTKEEIEKYGVSANRVFFAADELRSTGSDYPMALDAVGVGTVSAEDLRTIGQLVMRLRNLFDRQEIDLVVAKGADQSFIGGSRKFVDILRTAAKNLAIKKAKETFRSSKEQISNAFRSRLKNKLLYLPPQEAAALAKRFSPFFETTLSSDPFALFGIPDTPQEAIEILKEKARAQISLFIEIAKTDFPEILEGASAEIFKLLERAAELAELACTFPDEERLGLQLQTQVETELQNEHQVAVDLTEEEKSYRIEGLGEKFDEVAWNLERGSPDLYPVSALLADVDRGDEWIKRKGMYRTDFSSLFPSNVKITENLRLTLADPLPLFHPLQKEAAGLLMTKAECILLSQKDLAYWMERGETPAGYWLLDLQGEPLLRGAESFPAGDESEELVWYAELFNGHVASLERSPILTKAAFETAPALMYQFLYLKTTNMPAERNLLENSGLFHSETTSLRKEKERVLRLSLETMSAEGVAAIKEDLVPFLPHHQVQHLTTLQQVRRLSSSQVDSVSPAVLPFLLPRQIRFLNRPDLVQALQDPRQIREVVQFEHLLEEQKRFHPGGIKALSDPEAIRSVQDPELIKYFGPAQVVHLLPAQIPHMSPKWASFLREREQIQALQGGAQINAIDSSGLPHLTPDQIGALRAPSLVRQLKPSQIPHLLPAAVQFLDAEQQLPHLAREQHAYVSVAQHRTIVKMENRPPSLDHLVSRLDTNFYEQFFKKYVPASTPWRSLILQLSRLGDEAFEKMETLWIKGSPAAHLPELRRCKNLTYVGLRSQSLEDFDWEVISFVKTLHIHYSKLTFPKIRKWTRLTRLLIEHADLKVIPPWIGELKALQRVDLHDNEIEEIPDELCELTDLEVLELDQNRIKKVPEGIGKLVKLTKLLLFCNELTELPESIGNLEKVEELHLGGNRLVELPGSIGRMKKLRKLFLRSNQLRSLPSTLEHLPAFTALNLDMNPIGEIPEVVYKLRGLKSLSLICCSLTHIPSEIQKLTSLRKLWIERNPIVSSPDLSSILLKEPERMDENYNSYYVEIPPEEQVAELVPVQPIEIPKRTYSVWMENEVKERYYHDFTKAERLEMMRVVRPEIAFPLLFEEAKRNRINCRGDKVVTNLFLDKTWTMTKSAQVTSSDALEKEGLYGFPAYFGAALIARAMNGLADPFWPEFQRALSQAAIWAKRLEEPGEAAGVVQEILADIGAKKRVLVPFGTKTHNILLQIYNGNVTVYNTGLGLERHPRYGEKRLFETKMTWNEVPASSLHDRKAWLDLLALVESDVDSRYEIIKTRLTKGGTLVPQSNDLLDYSGAQLQGTCAATVWWNWLRHEIVAFLTEKGDRFKAYGEWRGFKLRLRKNILQETPDVSEKLRKIAEDKISKHSQLVQLFDAAKDPVLYEQMASQFRNFLPKKEAEKLQVEFAEHDNIGSRWQFLRTLARRAAEELFASAKREDIPSLAALSMLDWETSKEALTLMFQDAEEKQDWSLIGRTLGRVALDPKLAPVAIELSKKWLLLSPAAAAKLLNSTGAEQRIQEDFFYFVSRGKGQERTLRLLGTYFREHRKIPLAKTFWSYYRAYEGSSLAKTVYDGTLDFRDLALLIESVHTLPEVNQLLLALRQDFFNPQARKMISSLLETALRLDDRNYSALHYTCEILYAEGFDHFADQIRLAVSSTRK